MTTNAIAAPSANAENRHAVSRRTKAGRQMSAGPYTYVILAIVVIISVFPLYYTLIIASHTNHDMAATPPPFVPNASVFHNIRLALHQQPLVKAMVNSLIVAGSITIGTVAFCTLSGFAFAKLRFRGSGPLLGLTIATMAIPPQLGVIPLFLLIAKLHWVNHLQSVVLPTLVSAFGVFFMRQFLANAMPTELLEAGWVDGASTFRIFRSIVLPIARPAMAVLGMLTFLAAWNDFFWPLIALTSRNPTVQVGLAGLGSGYIPEQAVIMGGTLLCTFPVLVVFALLGRQIVGGIMQGAVKG
ncbi:MAG: carbohydrate ABC transporter permease [Acidothermaceae bacterium]